MAEVRDLYELLAAAEVVSDVPYASIQWKGTEVCIDLHCECGVHGHLDVDFDLYQVRCGACGRHFAVGTRVVLAPMTAEEVSASEDSFHEF